MSLENKLGIVDSLELVRVKEKLSKIIKTIPQHTFDEIIEIKPILKVALTDKVKDGRGYVKGIDISYFMKDIIY